LMLGIQHAYTVLEPRKEENLQESSTEFRDPFQRQETFTFGHLSRRNDIMNFTSDFFLFLIYTNSHSSNCLTSSHATKLGPFEKTFSGSYRVFNSASLGKFTPNTTFPPSPRAVKCQTNTIIRK
jgi:hypothetical protein